MEVGRTPLHHPDQDHVRALIIEILEHSRKRVAAWRVEMMEYDFYSSVYNARLTLEGNTAVAEIPAEWIDDAWKAGGKFKRRPIKRALREAVEKFYELDDE